MNFYTDMALVLFWLALPLVAVYIIVLIYARIRKRESIWIYSLKRTCILCFISLIAFMLCGIICNFLPSPQESGYFNIILRIILLCSVFLIFPIGLILLIIGAIKNGFGKFKTIFSFLGSFALLLLVYVAIAILEMVYTYNTWQRGEIADGICIELRPMFTLTSEYYRRIVFKSGKTVDIMIDPCGKGEFNVYRLPDNSLFLECTWKESRSSFLINPSGETVEQVEGIDMKNASHIGFLSYTKFYPGETSSPATKNIPSK